MQPLTLRISFHGPSLPLLTKPKLLAFESESDREADRSVNSGVNSLLRLGADAGGTCI